MAQLNTVCIGIKGYCIPEDVISDMGLQFSLSDVFWREFSLVDCDSLFVYTKKTRRSEFSKSELRELIVEVFPRLIGKQVVVEDESDKYAIQNVFHMCELKDFEIIRSPEQVGYLQRAFCYNSYSAIQIAVELRKVYLKKRERRMFEEIQRSLEGCTSK